MAEALPMGSFVCCHARAVTPTGRTRGVTYAADSGDVRDHLRKPRMGMHLPAGLFRKDELRALGGYDERIKSHVDYDLWFALARHHFSAHFIDKCLVELLEHDESRLTRNVDLRLEATRVLFHKWQPEFEEWFGVRPGRRYIRRHRAACLAELAFTSVLQGSRRRGARLFLSAIASHPSKIKYYVGLVSAMTHPCVYAVYKRLGWSLRKQLAGRPC